jgi:hypothetical protein
MQKLQFVKEHKRLYEYFAPEAGVWKKPNMKWLVLPKANSSSSPTNRSKKKLLNN